MKYMITLLALAIAVSASGLACAQDGVPPPGASATAHAQQSDKVPMRERFMQMDSNHDGLLTNVEVGDNAPALARRFEQIDANHDGKLSMVEIHQAKLQRKAMKAQRDPSQQGQTGSKAAGANDSDAMEPDSSDGQ